MEYQIFMVGTISGRREATYWASQTWSTGPAKARVQPAIRSVKSITVIPYSLGLTVSAVLKGCKTAFNWFRLRLHL